MGFIKAVFKRGEWIFWLQWVMANALGWAVGIAVTGVQWLIARKRRHRPGLVTLVCRLISLWSLSGVSLLVAFVAAVLLVQEQVSIGLGQILTGTIAGIIGGAVSGLPLLVVAQGYEWYNDSEM